MVVGATLACFVSVMPIMVAGHYSKPVPVCCCGVKLIDNV